MSKEVSEKCPVCTANEVEAVKKPHCVGATDNRNEFGYDHSLGEVSEAVGVNTDTLQEKVNEIGSAWMLDRETPNSVLTEELEKALSTKELAVLATELILSKVVEAMKDRNLIQEMIEQLKEEMDVS